MTRAALLSLEAGLGERALLWSLEMILGMQAAFLDLEEAPAGQADGAPGGASAA